MAYDAVAMLESLFKEPPDPGAAGSHQVAPADLPPDWHFEWDERSAILEYEQGLPRERAEVLALADVLKRMRDTRK